MSRTSQPVPNPLILVAEDDMDDQLLLQEALRENGFVGPEVMFVEDGEKLLDALAALSTTPRLIILDLNMPRKDGRETLRELKSNEGFKHIPVVILTTSRSEDDIRLAYRNGGNTFFIKPPVFQELVEIVRVIKQYWFERAALVL